MMCKKEYFTKLIYKENIFQHGTKKTIIQQYDIYNLEIHVGQGLEIGPETTNATKGIKLSRRKTT